MMKIELELDLKNDIDPIKLGKHITNNMDLIFESFSKEINSVTCVIYSDDCSNCNCNCEEEDDPDDDDSDVVDYIDLCEIDTDTLLEEIKSRINESTNDY